MREVFFPDRNALFGGMDKAARLFYQQAYRPGFKSKLNEVIEKEARLSIKYRFVKHMKENAYTRAECKAWPELPSGTPTLQEITEDLKKIYYDNKRTLTTFKLDLSLKNFQFEFCWQDESLEDASIAQFRDIILGHYSEYSLIDSTTHDDMCKIFYKKLPINNKFTDNFMAQTKKYIKGVVRIGSKSIEMEVLVSYRLS